MRKLLIAALMILGTSAAFAGDSDALKAILKAKTYDDAKQLLTQNLASLASAEEKAKAYNKLVELSLDKVNKEQTVQAENQMTGGNKAVDEDGLYTAVGNALPMLPSAMLTTSSPTRRAR